MQVDKGDPFGLAAGPSEGRERAGAVRHRRDRDGARHPVTRARSPCPSVIRSPIGFTIINSGSTASTHVNCRDSVQRSSTASGEPLGDSYGRRADRTRRAPSSESRPASSHVPATGSTGIGVGVGVWLVTA